MRKGTPITFRRMGSLIGVAAAAWLAYCLIYKGSVGVLVYLGFGSNAFKDTGPLDFFGFSFFNTHKSWEPWFYAATVVATVALLALARKGLSRLQGWLPSVAARGTPDEPNDIGWRGPS